MKVLEKIQLLDRIGRELQSRMTYSDIEAYLTAYGVNCKGVQPSTNSKWVYVKELLAGADEGLLIAIANELEILHNFSTSTPREATFWKSGHFRLFLSHLSTFKGTTAKLQSALRKYAISAFVAHEDIEPSKEWQIEIEAALHTMDAMAAILMPGFKESNWCDQEVGVAVGRDVLIVPIMKGLLPYGFIGKYQGIQASNKTIAQVAEEVFETIVKSDKTRTKIIGAIANLIAQAKAADEAKEKLEVFRSIDRIPKSILENLKNEIQENSVLINSKEFIQLFNTLLITYSIESLKFGSVSSTDEFLDDIPF